MSIAVTTVPVYMGVDPGASGGLVVIHEGAITSAAMPGTIQQLWQWFAPIGPNSRYWDDIEAVPDIHCAIEQVTGYVAGRDKQSGGDYENSAPGHRMFQFGKSYGRLEMALEAAGIKAIPVIPRTWQKALGIAPRDKATEDQAAFKRRLKQTAIQLFPSVTVTLKTCDALLLALYAKLLHERQAA
jgi:hypothetical protein